MEGKKRAMWNVGATSIKFALLSQQIGSPVSICKQNCNLCWKHGTATENTGNSNHAAVTSVCLAAMLQHVFTRLT